MSCERAWQVDAVEDGRLSPSDPSFQRHQRACAECRERVASNGRLRAHLRALPERTPPELALRRLRERVLRDAAASPPAAGSSRRIAQVVLALVAAIMLFAILVLGRSVLRAGETDDARWAGAVVALDGARWLQARGRRTERVSLLEGRIRVFVRKQAPDERFLVIVPDGEMEVRGTTFEVVVYGGATRHVEVVEGAVELRVRGQHGPTLIAGQTWDAPALASSEPSSPQPSPSTPTSARSSAPDVTVGRSHPPRPGVAVRADDWMSDYEVAMNLYRGGRFEEAAAAFDRFVVSHPAVDTIDDALFLQSASLARAGRGDAAAVVAAHQIERFPSSLHHKEASILVARAARDRKDCDAARRALSPWFATRDAEAIRELGGCAGVSP